MVGGGRSEPLVGGDGAPPGKNMKRCGHAGERQVLLQYPLLLRRSKGFRVRGGSAVVVDAFPGGGEGNADDMLALDQAQFTSHDTEAVHDPIVNIEQ